MAGKRKVLCGGLLVVIVAAITSFASPTYALTSGTAQVVTWTCTGSPCPQGPTTNSRTIVWPSGYAPSNQRLGYTTSAGVYVPATHANGIRITIKSGSATAYAGLPQATTHRSLGTISAGRTLTISGLATGEVLSVTSSTTFRYTATDPAVPTTTTTTTIPTTTTTVPTTTTTIPTTTTTTIPGPIATNSQFVTWACTHSPCPWGSSLSTHALVWPTSFGATDRRLGYTTSARVYLPDEQANGLTISVQSGSATAYAGLPQSSSHQPIASINAGQSVTISGLATGEMFSVQSDNSFTYTTTTPSTPPTTTTTVPTTTTTIPTTTTTVPTTTTTIPTTTTTTIPGPIATNSQFVTWACTHSPCPWGSSLSTHALVWPTSFGATDRRLGYTTSARVYLPDEQANGLTISVQSGSATAYAGLPQSSSHQPIASINAGQSVTISGLATGEMFSVQSDNSFTYTTTTPSTPPTTTTTVPTTTTTIPTTTTTIPTTTTTIPSGPCTDPTSCSIVDAIIARWRCNTPGCNSADWEGAVINWPSWAAYSTNNRTGYNSRIVYSTDGNVLYPYMGQWANGCEVTAVSGVVLIIEWQRGTDVWSEILLQPGQSHVINLVSPENGAMIEAPNVASGFRVSLRNCTPQPVP